MTFRKESILILFVLGWFARYSSGASGVHFPVPDRDSVLLFDANLSTLLPFSGPGEFGSTYYGPIRYQQVYSASEFSKIPAGGAFLARLFLRMNCTPSGFGFAVVATNLQINASTTQRDPDGLDPRFSENVGRDDIAIFGPGRYLVGGISQCSSPGAFSAGEVDQINPPFFYDPSKGNLLLDFRSGGIASEREPLLLDAQDTPGDSMSCVAAYSLTNEVAEVVDSRGLITYFEFYTIPSITVSNDVTALYLTWPLYPFGFKLQSATKVGSAAKWQLFPEEPTPIGLFVTQTISTSSLSAQQYFRLYLDTPQSVPGQGDVGPVGLNPN